MSLNQKLYTPDRLKHNRQMMSKHFVQQKQNTHPSSLLLGPADFWNIVMLCQGVQMTIKIL